MKKPRKLERLSLSALFSLSQAKRSNKLERLSLVKFSSQPIWAGTRVWPNMLKSLARHKHPSLFYRSIGDEEKKFYNTDDWFAWVSPRFFFPARLLSPTTLERPLANTPTTHVLDIQKIFRYPGGTTPPVPLGTTKKEKYRG
jgi:hypothetical protein